MCDAPFKCREWFFDGNRTIGGSNKRGKNLAVSAKRSMVMNMDHERLLRQSQMAISEWVIQIHVTNPIKGGGLRPSVPHRGDKAKFRRPDHHIKKSNNRVIRRRKDMSGQDSTDSQTNQQYHKVAFKHCKPRIRPCFFQVGRPCLRPIQPKMLYSCDSAPNPQERLIAGR